MSRNTLGNLLIAFGALAWITYYGLKFLTPVELPFWIFLTWHLSGVIPGALLRENGRIASLVRGVRKSTGKALDRSDAS